MARSQCLASGVSLLAGKVRGLAVVAAYIVAAEQSYGKAQYNLGNIYHYGRGVTQSYADHYFRTSLAASATDYSGNLRPEGVQKWRDEAVSYLAPAELSQVQERVRKWLEDHPPKAP